MFMAVVHEEVDHLGVRHRVCVFGCPRDAIGEEAGDEIVPPSSGVDLEARTLHGDGLRKDRTAELAAPGLPRSR